jgi:hypothetical protein
MDEPFSVCVFDRDGADLWVEMVLSLIRVWFLHRIMSISWFFCSNRIFLDLSGSRLFAPDTVCSFERFDGS